MYLYGLDTYIYVVGSCKAPIESTKISDPKFDFSVLYILFYIIAIMFTANAGLLPNQRIQGNLDTIRENEGKMIDLVKNQGIFKFCTIFLMF